MKFFDSIMWTKQYISADSILPTSNQHVTFTLEAFNIYKNYEEKTCSLPSLPMNFIANPQVEPGKAGRLHYCKKFVKHVNLFMSE